MISKLIHAKEDGAGVLRPDEIPEFVTSMLVAGYETTANLISTCVRLLATKPRLAEEVAADRALVPAFVEEVLRHDGPVQLLMRRTTRAVELGGVTLPGGAMVLPLLGSANRDERRFVDPDRFDLHREDGAHLAFGQGVHFCLGAALARIEAQEAVDGVLDLLDALEWLGDPYEPVPALMMRGPSTLRFRRRQARGPARSADTDGGVTRRSRRRQRTRTTTLPWTAPAAMCSIARRPSAKSKTWLPTWVNAPRLQ